MGLFFPVYSTVELSTLDQQKREKLKWDILHTLLHDPDVLRLVEDKLPNIRAVLHDKTKGVFDLLAGPKP